MGLLLTGDAVYLIVLTTARTMYSLIYCT